MTDLAVKTTVTTLDLEHEPVPAEQLVSGAPTTGAVTLGQFGDVEIGVWEITPGVSTDVEADEIFIVLTGAATVHFEDTDETLPVGPGDVVRLIEGQRTTWTVTETLRKVYIV